MADRSTVSHANPSKADEVRKLHAAGLPTRQIAHALGITTQGVHWHLRRLGLRPNTPKETT